MTGYAGSLCNKNAILSGTIKAITVDARFVTTFVATTHLRVRNSPATGPYHKSDEPSGHPSILLPYGPFSFHLPFCDSTLQDILIPVGYPVQSLYAFLFYGKYSFDLRGYV